MKLFSENNERSINENFRFVNLTSTNFLVNIGDILLILIILGGIKLSLVAASRLALTNPKAH